MFKLSPSDFAYLYEECKLCYYLKIKQGIQRPFSPFPAVFTALNTRIQGALIGKDLRKLSSVLPSGIVESQEGFVESQLVPNTQLFIKGKYDLLVRQPDGTYLIVYFKISQPSEENITKLGLIVMYPDKTVFNDGKVVVEFPPKWLEVSIHKDSFLSFIYEVNSLLNGPTPNENPNCGWCRYRHLGEHLTHPTQSDLPF